MYIKLESFWIEYFKPLPPHTAYRVLMIQKFAQFSQQTL